jgi:hypothetical protein
MNNTTRVDAMKRIAMIMAAATMVAASVSHPAAAQPSAGQAQPAANSAKTLSQKQQANAPISAATAVGDIPRLNQALNRGQDAGLTLSETKEILVQMYAYTGLPRSLNALGS